MLNRKSFLAGSLAAAWALLEPVPVISLNKAERKKGTMKTTSPKKAAVIWYSQTGHTERYGKTIASVFRKNGLKVTASDYRKFDAKSIGSYDLVVMGSPVYYYEVPENFRSWIAALPSLEGIPVAAYVTFGGPGGNQYNAAMGLLQFQEEKGGIPVGMDMFGNMSTFAPTWSMGNVERILKYRHLPNKETYGRVKSMALRTLQAVWNKKTIKAEKKIDFREMFKGGISLWGTKLLMGKHHIDTKTCLKCGTCVEKCPAGAIDLTKQKVNTSRCIACLGCVNNCPVQAMKMEFLFRPVYGFNRFVEMNKVKIAEPEEG